MAVNEFGARLDRNGYAESIVQAARRSVLSGEALPLCRCYLCGRPEGRGFGERLERHEPWGAANRGKSKELGLWVLLHRMCHEEAHRDAETGEDLRKDAQRAAMLRYGWSREEWIRRFGKSELDEAEAGRVIGGKGDVRKGLCSIPQSAAGAADSSLFEREPLGARAGGFRVLAEEPAMPY